MTEFPPSSTQGEPPPRAPLLGGLGIGIWIAVILLILWGDWVVAQNWRHAIHLAGYPVGLAIGIGGAIAMRISPQADPKRATIGCAAMLVLVAAIFAPRLVGPIGSGVVPGTILGFAGTRLVQALRLRAGRSGPNGRA